MKMTFVPDLQEAQDRAQKIDQIILKRQQLLWLQLIAGA
jgi:hypothetical protein